MDIDLSILRMLEREKEISFDVLVEAIEQALLTAYHKTPGAAGARARRARPQERPRHGVRRRARRRGQQGRGVRRHPRGLRPDRRDDREADHAAAAARRRGRHPVRRVLRQGGRHHLRRHPAGPQPRRRDGRPRQARGAAAAGRAGAGRALRARRRGSSAWWSRCARACAGRRSRCRAPTPTWSRSCSRSRSPRSPTAPSRSPRSPARPATAPRSRSAPTSPGVNAKGSCIGPMGQRVRNVMSELHGEKIDIVDWSDDPAELVAHALSPARVTAVEVVDARGRARRGSSCPTSSCRWRSARRARTPASPPGSPAGGSTSAPTRRRPPRPPSWPAPRRSGPRLSAGTRWSSPPSDHSGKSKTATISWSGYAGGVGAAAYLLGRRR